MKHLFLIVVTAAGFLLAGCASSRHANPDSPQPPTMTATPAAHLLIIAATYGSGTQFADVTDRVNTLLRLSGVEFFARPEWLKADPTPGWNKALVIIYEFKGRRHVFSTGEGGAVSDKKLIQQARREGE